LIWRFGDWRGIAEEDDDGVHWSEVASHLLLYLIVCDDLALWVLLIG
jgi:hypothetical protein